MDFQSAVHVSIVEWVRRGRGELITYILRKNSGGIRMKQGSVKRRHLLNATMVGRSNS